MVGNSLEFPVRIYSENSHLYSQEFLGKNSKEFQKPFRKGEEDSKVIQSKTSFSTDANNYTHHTQMLIIPILHIFFSLKMLL